MDNLAMKDDAMQSNSTDSKRKDLVRMESVVNSVTSTQELIDASAAVNFHTNSKAGKIRAMITISTRKLLAAIIFLLSMAVLALAALYILEYHKMKESVVPSTTKEPIKCLEFTPTMILDDMSTKLNAILPTIEAKIVKASKAYGLKALSYGIAYNGKLLWTFHYGHKNYTNTSSPKPNSDTPYPAASISKLFTAVMLLKLIENGTINSIDDPINKYDPQFNVINPFNSEHITFRQLACMTSGLPREAPCNPPEKYNFCPYNTSEMWRRLSSVELQLGPSMATSYSNLGFAVLGRVLGRILPGLRYEDWMKREMFDRIGLRNTGFNIRQRYNSIPVSQDPDGKMSRIIDWGWLRPAAGIYTSINDLHKFINILIERFNTTVLSKPSKRFMVRNEYERQLACPMAIWQLDTGETTIDKSRKKIQHQTFYTTNGVTVGYTSQVRVSPQNTLATYALCANGGNDFGFFNLDLAIGSLVYTTVAKALKEKEEKYIAPSNMEAYVGTYRRTSYWPLLKGNLIISIRYGRLHLNLDWFNADLTYVSPWKVKTVYPLHSTNCKDAYIATGLLNSIYVFERPTSGQSKCPSVYVRSITAYGYMSFVRA